MQRPRSVLIVDDHPIVREGLRALLNQQPDLRACAEATNSREALEALAAHKPDAALVDVALNRENGLELISLLKSADPRIVVLALSMHDEFLFAERALRHGASGYVMKHEATDQLLTALRQVLCGKTFYSNAVTERLLRSLSPNPRSEQRVGVERLSARELEVFRLIGMGLSTTEIAKQLHISNKTVETHRLRVKDKLEVETATQLVVLAVQYFGDVAIKGENRGAA
jgi:DNA-binding NarL/FixJ family response regulator